MVWLVLHRSTSRFDFEHDVAHEKARLGFVNRAKMNGLRLFCFLLISVVTLDDRHRRGLC